MDDNKNKNLKAVLKHKRFIKKKSSCKMVTEFGNI